MALSTTPVDINRGTEGLVLPEQLSTEIWAGAIEQSAVMQLAERIELPGSGIAIPVITGDPVAQFVAESTEKPVSTGTFSTKTMKAYKLAVIEPFSNEFMRDYARLYDELVRRLPGAIAKAFDATVFGTTAPGTGFDVLGNSTAKAIDPQTAYADMVGVIETLGAADASLTGIAASAQAQALFLSAVDGAGRPLFSDSPESGRLGRILGADVVKAQAAYAAGTPNTVAYAGDWSQARYGIVNGINISVSDQATLNDGEQLIHLWQRNMSAVRIEAEVGFVVRNAGAFVKLTD